MTHWASKERAWREVAGSGGLPTALAYPVLALCTGLAGDFWIQRSPLLFTVVVVLGAVSLARELVGRRLRQVPEREVWTWHRRYAATVLLQGLVWTAFGSVTIYLNGRTWTGLMALLVTAGIVAGSTASLTPSFPLMRAYILLVCLPTSAAFVLHGSRAEMMVGTTVATYCYFMLAVGRRNSLREQTLRMALGELETARAESDSHREQLRRLSASQLAEIEKERLFLSREIHDDLGQVLTALKLTFARLEKQVVEDEPLLDKFQPMKELLDTAMVSVRNIAGSLRPPLLDELGLAPAIDRFAQESCKRANLTCQLRLPSSLPALSQDLSLAAFRVCQEGLTNCIRHAQASNVEVELRLEAQALVVAVADDGIGIPAGRPEGALGLLGLRERVRLLNGTVDICGNQPRGTRLEARFPLTQVGPDRVS